MTSDGIDHHSPTGTVRLDESVLRSDVNTTPCRPTRTSWRSTRTSAKIVRCGVDRQAERLART
jgi:hypothetical protein